MGIFDIFKRRQRRPEVSIPRPPRIPDIRPPDTLEKELEEAKEAPAPEPLPEISPILFGPPCIISLDLDAIDLAPSPVESFQRGKYILGAAGDRVRFFGMLYAPAGATNDAVNQRLKHADMPYLLETLLQAQAGLVLGGGFLDADHAAKSLRAFRGSGTYGLAPEFMVRLALKESNYSVSVKGSELACPEKKAAAEWYSRHGIALERRSFPYED